MLQSIFSWRARAPCSVLELTAPHRICSGVAEIGKVVTISASLAFGPASKRTSSAVYAMKSEIMSHWPATSASSVHVEYIERLLRTRESSNKRCRANPSCQILVLPFLCTWATFGVFRCHPARWDAAGPPVSGRTARCRGAAQKLRVCPCRGGYSDLANPLQAKRCRLSSVLLAEKYRVHMNELQRTPGRRRWLFGVKSKRRLWPLRPWPRVTKGFSPIVSRQGPHSGGRAPPGRGWESTFLFFSPRLHPWRLSNKRAPLTESPEGGPPVDAGMSILYQVVPH